MKKVLTGICMALLLVCAGCGEQNENVAVIPTEKPIVTEEPVPTEGPMDANEQESKGYVEKQNVTIEGRNYSYIKYRVNPDSIRLISLKTEEDVLVIPSYISDIPVISIGGEPDEVLGMPKKGAIERQMIGRYSWLVNDKQELKKIIIQEGIVKILDEAFRNVVAKEIEMPKSLKIVSPYAFTDAKIEKVIVKNKNAVLGWNSFATRYLKTVDFPNGFQGEIQSNCFEGTQLESFDWPKAKGNKNAKVGFNAFERCDKLKEVNFYENQKNIFIRENMFAGCRSLKKLVFPASTGKVIYETNTDYYEVDAEQYEPDEHEKGFRYKIKELVFLGENTELVAGTYKGKDFIMAGKIVAPKGSKAIQYAKKASGEMGKDYGKVPYGMGSGYGDKFVPLEYEEI